MKIDLKSKHLELAVWHLKKNVRSELLEKCFSSIGPVWNVHIIPDNKNPDWNYGFVTMLRDDALSCVYRKRIKICGERVFVTLATGKPSLRSQRIDFLRERSRGFE